MDNVDNGRLASAEEHLQCECGVERVLFLQKHQWYGKVTVAVAPAYTSQECSDCGAIVKKSLSTRTHVCACGCALDRDENAAINILRKGIATAGHAGSWLLDSQNASGDEAATVLNSGSMQQVTS